MDHDSSITSQTTLEDKEQERKNNVASPKTPETKEDILWIKHTCGVCNTVTSYLDGGEPHCVKCSIDEAKTKDFTMTGNTMDQERREGTYCLQDCIETKDTETLARIKSECADLGCNICLSQITNNDVDWPTHYNMGKIEVIEAIESWDLDFRLANVIKYVARAGKKDLSTKKKDLLKAQWYLNRFIEKELNDE